MIVLIIYLGLLALNCEYCRSHGLMEAAENGFNATDMAIRNLRQARNLRSSESCLTNDGGPGTCMTRFNCMRQGGTARGFCSTYGVCCETNMQCNTISRLKRTIIRNPPQINMTTCQYTIEAFSTNVCQLLIEFRRFELQQPTVGAASGAAECTDHLEVGGFRLCGDNSGQHLYIPFTAAAGIEFVTLAFNMPSLWMQSNWRLVLTQLECPATSKRRSVASPFLPFLNQNSITDFRTFFSVPHNDLEVIAPPGCDQYYTQPTGTVKSFNYRDNIANSYYMANLHYVMCFKPPPGATMIEYTIRRFSLTTEVNTSEANYDTACRSTVATQSRREDYLLITQSILANTPDVRPTYYCGTMPPNQLILASQPFTMVFSSDDITDTTDTGFSLQYNMRSVLR